MVSFNASLSQVERLADLHLKFRPVVGKGSNQSWPLWRISMPFA